MSTPAQNMLSAVLAGEVIPIARLLESDPQLCNLTDKSAENLSVLHHAASRGDLEIVELLLIAGANVNKRSHDGSTPLHFASAGGHLEVVQRLVNSGGNTRLLTNGGMSACSAAHHNHHQSVADFLRQYLHERRS